MGPALCRVFYELGAEVITDPRPLLTPELPTQVVHEAGQIDALVINLAVMAPSPPATEVGDEEWQRVRLYGRSAAAPDACRTTLDDRAPYRQDRADGQRCSLARPAPLFFL